MPATRGLGFLGRTRERELLDGCSRRHARAERRPGDPRRAGHREDGAAALHGAAGFGPARRADRRSPGGDGAAVRRDPSAVRADVRPARRASRTAAERAATSPWASRPGDAPDRFLVALAVLSLLCAVAEERPLLCLVDDAQWLDAASGQTLGFVARRLLAESVAIVFALREPIASRTFDGLPELPLDGLEEPDARALLSRAVPGRLDDRVRDRIIAETRGNPLALLELSRSMSAAERAGGYRASRRKRSSESGGRAVRAARRRAARGDAATDPAGGSRPARGRHAAVAGGRATLHRRERRGAGGRCRPAGDRRPGPVPPSAGALGGLPGGVARRPTARTRSAGGGE